MPPFLQLALVLVVVLLAAKLAGYLASRLGQPSVLGGLVAGGLLGSSLSDFYEPGESLSRTIFSVVRDDETIEKVRLATRQVIGDLNRPDTGLFIVLPVDQADGLDKKQE